MRIDDYLSTVGLIKRRTVAKELAHNGMITVNGRVVKPAYQVKPKDIIQLKGKNALAVEVLELPSGSIAKTDRENYYKELKVE
ncbi:MAG: S4 domain-containing protein [Candidatus Zixiibacteriota bacterium]